MGQAADVMRRKIAAFNAHDATEMLAVFNPDTQKEVSAAQVLAVRSRVLAKRVAIIALRSGWPR
jgi:hypothetical protein